MVTIIQNRKKSDGSNIYIDCILYMLSNDMIKIKKYLILQKNLSNKKIKNLNYLFCLSCILVRIILHNFEYMRKY